MKVVPITAPPAEGDASSAPEPASATCKRCGARWTVEGEAVRRVHEPRPAPERAPKTEEVG